MTVESRIDGKRSEITLSRSNHRNAITIEMMKDLTSGIKAAENSGCLVLTVRGSGEDFAVGRDHSESPRAHPPGSTREEWITSAGFTFEALAAFSGVSIVVAKGMTLGWGCAFATTADICVAASTARFAFDEVPMGFAPLLVIGGLVGRLSERVLIELVATGRSFDAQEALRLGIATQVEDPLGVDSATAALVSQILNNDEEAAREAKRLIKERAAMDPIARRDMSLTDWALGK